MTINHYIQEIQNDNANKYNSIFVLHENATIQDLENCQTIIEIETDKLSENLETHKKKCQETLLKITSTPIDDFNTILSNLQRKNKINRENKINQEIKLKERLELAKEINKTQKNLDNLIIKYNNV